VTKEWGGWWTEAKLDILSKYLGAFNRASRATGGTVYLDLSAGQLSAAQKGEAIAALREFAVSRRRPTNIEWEGHVSQGPAWSV